MTTRGVPKTIILPDLWFSRKFQSSCCLSSENTEQCHKSSYPEVSKGRKYTILSRTSVNSLISTPCRTKTCKTQHRNCSRLVMIPAPNMMGLTLMRKFPSPYFMAICLRNLSGSIQNSSPKTWIGSALKTLGSMVFVLLNSWRKTLPGDMWWYLWASSWASPNWGNAQSRYRICSFAIHTFVFVGPVCFQKPGFKREGLFGIHALWTQGYTEETEYERILQKQKQGGSTRTASMTWLESEQGNAHWVHTGGYANSGLTIPTSTWLSIISERLKSLGN